MASQLNVRPPHRARRGWGAGTALRIFLAVALAFLMLPMLSTAASAEGDVADDAAVELVGPEEEVLVEESSEVEPAGDQLSEEQSSDAPLGEEQDGAPTTEGEDTSEPSEPSVDAAPVEPGAPDPETGPDKTKTDGLMAAVDEVVTAAIDSPTPINEADLQTADYVVEDEDGANDKPGQVDVTQLWSWSVQDGVLNVAWSWDEVDWSGQNTGDACALFDTDEDGNANFAVCVTIDDNPAVQIEGSPRVYECKDTDGLKCFDAELVVPADTTCIVDQTDTDPFVDGALSPTDTTALCEIVLADVTGASEPVITNVCSYPSQIPNSNPFDCVLAPRDALLTIVKVLSPTQPAAEVFDFTVTTPTAGDPNDQIINVSTGDSNGETFGIASGKNVTLQEVVPAGWELLSAVCTNGVSADPADSPITLNLRSGQHVTCTFTNSKTASVVVDKEWVVNGDTYENGDPALEQYGLSAQLTLTGPGSAGVTDQDWGVSREGYLTGDVATIDEEEPVITNELCEFVDGRVTTADEQDVDLALPYSPTLSGGSNRFTITNTVTCGAELTLEKSVTAPSVPGDWTLTATAAGEAVPGPSGESGTTAATGPVTPGATYTLSEAGSAAAYIANYVQQGSWQCTDGVTMSGNQVSVPAGLSATCTVTNATAELALKKVVTNDSGGTADAADFPLSATPSSTGPTVYTDIDGSGEGTTVYVRPGVTYTLAENGVAGYELESLVCTRNGDAMPDVSKAAPTLKPAAYDQIVCTFTNNDVSPRLTLLKDVDNGDTGANTPDTAWTLSASGPTAISGSEGATTVTDAAVDAGTYTLAESGGPDGYAASAWVCTKPGTGQSGPVPVPVTNHEVTLGLGEHVTCEVTNTAIAPELTLVKEVVNASGGTAASDDWTLTAEPLSIAGQDDVTGPGGGTDAVVDRPVKVGSYTLSESSSTGYDWTSLACTNDGTAMPAVSRTSPTVTLGLGDEVTCTFTNTDKPSTLTLVKIVDANDTDSDASPADWTLSAEPQSISGQGLVSGSGDPAAEDGVFEEVVFAGQYVLSEADGPDGFTPGTWVCEGFATTDTVDGVATVTIPNGADVVCEITNTAAKPQLTLVKEVVNGTSGATAVAEDWLLTADGPGELAIEGQGGVDSADAKVGTYILSESGTKTGYHASDWTCTEPGGEGQVTFPVTGGDTITLAEGDDVTCTITNTAVAPKLTLVKNVVNGDTGADALKSAWTLTADGPGDDDLAGFGGASGTVVAGDYVLAESGGPTGYTPSDWSCVDAGRSAVAMADADTVTLGAGDDVTCTITNTAVAPRLTLVKVVDNAGAGGTAEATDWTLEADGPGTGHDLSGAGGDSGAVVVGDYALSETGGPEGYDASGWSCTKRVGEDDAPVTVTHSTVSLGLGDDVTCTITNTAAAPHLKLVKVVDNGSTGATYDEEDWRLEATGPVTIEGDGTASAAVSAGRYTLSESGPDGYDASDWVCLDEEDDAFPGADGETVTLELGDDVTCTITNTAIAPKLKLVKEVDNGDTGADAEPTDWTLTADGPGDPLSGEGGFPSTAVKIGTYDLSESGHPEGPDSYTASAWECVDGDGREFDTVDGDTVALGLGDDVTCTITNTAVAPTLELVKKVDNGDTGATAEPTDWTLTADGPGDPLSGEGGFEPTVVRVGDYDLSESGDPEGPGAYTASDWECVEDDGDPADMVDDDTVELEPGDEITCTITNSAVMPELTLVKVVENGASGATYDADDWTLTADGPGDAELSGRGTVSSELPVGDYDLSEAGPDGYTASDWVCLEDDGDPADKDDMTDRVELEPGDDITCTITNTAVVPRLTLVKVVDNGTTGRTATAKDWTLVADGPGESGLSGAGGASGTVPVGAYTLSESSGPAGYTPSAWQCTTPGTQGTDALAGNVVTLGLADDVTCTITNTASPVPPPPPPGTASVQVVKVDGVTGTPIDTAKFKLWRDTGSTAGVLDALDSLVSPGEVSTGTGGNATGTYLWPGLGQGAYLLQETAAPTGYDLSSPAVQAFTLTSAQVGTTVSKTVRNPQQDTTVEVVKVDDETGEVLEGAVFQAYEDDGTTAGVLDAEDTPVGGPATTNADGVAVWEGLLFGSYLLEEVTAPEGYGLPEDPVQAVTITAANAGGVIELRFLDPALGTLTLDKATFEQDAAGDWVASDGRVEFGDAVKYVVTATADGPKVHHDVVVSDYIPGYDPGDTTSDTEGIYVAGTAVCVDEGECTVTFGGNEQLLTWELGDMRDEARSVEFVIEFPEAGDEASMVEGVYTETLANTAAATWTDRAGDQEVDSNQVEVVAEIEVLPAEEERPVKPRPPVVLPDTGAPAGAGIWTTIGGLMLAVGALLLMRRRRDVS